MATLQSVNGKAPEGAQVGDIIVTNGGSWQITGGTPGNWTSQKVSDVSKSDYTPPAQSHTTRGVPIGTPRPSDFVGSASGITATQTYQNAIIDQMNQNSAAWWDAKTEAERDALHQQNQLLAAMLGGNISYDGSSGKWSGTAAAPYQPQNYNDYLNELYKAQLETQKEALKLAYETNLSDLQAEQDKLSANYESARKETQASNALARRNWNETAAAYGLNSGTQGQAALSYSNQLLDNLNALQAAESAANAEIERQRTILGKEYQSALVQAQADNDYERFQALYKEAVRVDQALQQQNQFNASQTMQQYQALLDKYYQDRNWNFSQEQWQYQQQQDQYDRDLEAAQLLAATGDYSAYGKLFGWDQSKINQLSNAWKLANTKTSSSGSSSSRGGGSSGGGSSGGTSNGAVKDPVLDAYRSGCRTYSAAIAYFKSMGYGDGLSQDLAKDLEQRIAKGQIGVNQQKVLQIYNNIVEMRDTSLNRNDPNFVRKAIEEYRKQTSLNLNDDEVAWLLAKFGYTS